MLVCSCLCWHYGKQQLGGGVANATVIELKQPASWVEEVPNFVHCSCVESLRLLTGYKIEHLSNYL